MAALAVAANVVAVRVSSRNPPGLVRPDYYDAGLRWDQRRQREAGYDSLGLRLELTEAGDSLIVAGKWTRPPDSARVARLAALRLKLFLQRPDDPAADRELALVPNLSASGESPRWSASAPGMRPGKWRCRAVFAKGATPLFERSFAHYSGE